MSEVRPMTGNVRGSCLCGGVAFEIREKWGPVALLARQIDAKGQLRIAASSRRSAIRR
jgi:hypothetical protein